MERDELGAWLRLTQTPGVGNQSARKLLAAFGAPQAVFSQTRVALQQVVSPALADALLCEPADIDRQLAPTWDWLRGADQPGVQRGIAVLGDALYPPSLLSMDDPPLLLYLMGQLSASAAQALAPCIAIVGSRNPTPQGLVNAKNFALACADA